MMTTVVTRGDTAVIVFLQVSFLSGRKSDLPPCNAMILKEIPVKFVRYILKYSVTLTHEPSRT